MAYLRTVIPATAAHLENGNLTAPLIFDGKTVTISLGFSYAGEVFYQYLEDRQVREKVISHFAQYFGIFTTNVRFTTVLLDLKTVTEQNFKTRAQLQAELAQEQEMELKQRFLNDPLVSYAQQLFGTQIDRVVLED